MPQPLPSPKERENPKAKAKAKNKVKEKARKDDLASGFSQRAPCKFHALGNCTKGRDVPYFHSAFKQKVIGAVAQD